jgi:hypothetical protein
LNTEPTKEGERRNRPFMKTETRGTTGGPEPGFSGLFFEPGFSGLKDSQD